MIWIHTNGSPWLSNIVRPPSIACWSKNAMRSTRSARDMWIVDMQYMSTVMTVMTRFAGAIRCVCVFRLRGAFSRSAKAQIALRLTRARDTTRLPSGWCTFLDIGKIRQFNSYPLRVVWRFDEPCKIASQNMAMKYAFGSDVIALAFSPSSTL